MMARNSARVSGSARIGPMLVRVSAVAPEVPDRKMNLCQRSRSILSDCVMLMLAAFAAATKAARLASARPSMVPQMMLWNWLACLMTPGRSCLLYTSDAADEEDSVDL